MDRKTLITGSKITSAAIVAILVAGVLQLQFSPTAGIITILSIQKTKKETLKTAGRRGMAFLLAIIVSFLSFHILGFHVFAFAVYLLIFSIICLYFGWVEAIAMDSVLITHFLTEGNMKPEILMNEILLFIIGTGFGIIANLHLRNKKEEFETMAVKVDEEIRGILKRMADRLLREDKSDYDGSCFEKLEKDVEDAKESALQNYNNQLLNASYYEIDYMKMRESQVEVLKHVYESIKMVEMIPSQTKKIANLIVKIEAGYHKENTVKEFLYELERLEKEMKQENLPANREEFEARAVLFYMMKQLEEFLILKEKFMEKCHTKGGH
ncbi:MAG: hypothetical protein IJA34_02630 [Lachnospiraceae bacterium]|nr:hypothetical protein [Lachnospiraceae bacterium]